MLKKVTPIIILGAIFLIGTYYKYSRDNLFYPTSDLDEYWKKPVPLQGEASLSYKPVERSLMPKDCGSCHKQQHADWMNSRHAKAMGSGVIGQTLMMDPSNASSCYRCHAPLQEQHEWIKETKWISSSWKKNTQFNSKLQSQGLTCVACHVRSHKRYGPGQLSHMTKLLPKEAHGGFIRKDFFEKSEFCMGCHQFKSTEYKLNGKLLENTYQEWKESVYATSNVTCQNCHMPGRQHLWQGIHRKEMVQRALDIKVDVGKTPYEVHERTNIKVTIKNVGAGHYVPTYVTPKIDVLMNLIDENGNRLSKTKQTFTIGRYISLNLEKEYFDTRIPPQKEIEIVYQKKISRGNLKFEVRVIVYPDDFYFRFFKAKLESDNNVAQREHIKKALDDSIQSAYELFSGVYSLQN